MRAPAAGEDKSGDVNLVRILRPDPAGEAPERAPLHPFFSAIADTLGLVYWGSFSPLALSHRPSPPWGGRRRSRARGDSSRPLWRACWGDMVASCASAVRLPLAPSLASPASGGGSGRGRSSPPVRPSHRPSPPQGARALPTFPRVEAPAASRPPRRTWTLQAWTRQIWTPVSVAIFALKLAAAALAGVTVTLVLVPDARKAVAPLAPRAPLADPRPQGASEERTGEPTLERGIPINFPRRVPTVRYAPAAALGVPPVAARPMESPLPGPPQSSPQGASPAGVNGFPKETKVIKYDGGGDPDAYVKRAVNYTKQGIGLEILGECASACAEMVALIPKERICVGPNAKITIHHTANGDGSIDWEYTDRLIKKYPQYNPELAAFWHKHHGKYRTYGNSKSAALRLIPLRGQELEAIFPRCADARGQAAAALLRHPAMSAR